MFNILTYSYEHACENLFYTFYLRSLCRSDDVLRFSLGGRMMSVTPDPNTIITISRVTEEPDCSVCVNQESKQNCNPKELTLEDPTNTSVEFTCPRPQDVFVVEIKRDIGMKVQKKKWYWHFLIYFFRCLLFLAKNGKATMFDCEPTSFTIS